VADGIPMGAILLAVRTTEIAVAAAGKSGGSPVDITAEKRRAYDRDRKAEKRKSGGSPVESPVDNESALSFLGSNKNSKEEKKERAGRDRGRKLPVDWKPTEKHFEEGGRLGFSRAAVLSENEDMRLWARSNEHRAIARKANWDLTFSAWLRRNRPKGTAAPPTPDAPAYLTPPPGAQSLDEIRATYGKSNGQNIGETVRGDAGLGENGTDRREKLRLSG
jgi:hypothetical protein